MSAREHDPLPGYLVRVQKCGGCEKRGDTWFLCSYHEGMQGGYEMGRDAALEEAAKVAEAEAETSLRDHAGQADIELRAVAEEIRALKKS